MKASLGLRQIQRLTMTPELRQALGLLQMSAPELRDMVQEALEHNLLLEKIEDGEAPPLSANEPQVVAQAEPEKPAEPEDLPVADWDSAEPLQSWSDAEPGEFPEPSGPGGLSLQDHLRGQLDLAHLSARDAAIGALLIDSLNDDGYLTQSLDELRQAFGGNDGVPDAEEMEAMLHHLQALDPPGVACRDLRECLGIQLRQSNTAPVRELALRIVNQHLEDLAAHADSRLCRLLNVSNDELAAAIALIQSLNPRPGTALASSAVDFVIPDVVVSRRDGRWVVELNPETAPRLRVNAMYAAALGRRRNGENADLGRQLQEARWLVRSLKMRSETLLRVAECIVRHQADFLSSGEEAMQPLMLKDVAAELGLHESTISRVVANKYLAAPRGTLAFRHFFSNELSTNDGGALSATAIRALIRKLLAQENPHDPLSDDRITRELVNRGIRVARRTVAKYRESMAIPPAHQRKRLASRRQHQENEE
ncbi:MAG: RNA polymerase factor sigma-54 [Gammaproteobacteria bacterium]